MPLTSEKNFCTSIASHIQKQGVCPTGEDGEFHTLVLNAPHFYQRLEITTGEVIDDEWGYSQLTIAA